MISYTAGYMIDPDGVHAEELDFPGALTCGTDLAEARLMLADALFGMAEINLEMGEALPVPDPSIDGSGFDVVEPIHLVLSATSFEIAAETAS